MKYFIHDTSSFDDEKITELYLNFGYEGIGLFYTALEKIGRQEKPIKTDVLKAQLRVGKRLNKCWNFIEEIGLLSSINGETFSEELLNYSEKYKIKKEKTRKKVLQWRENKAIKNNVTGYEPDCNPSKVKESKVNKKESKKKFIPPTILEVKEYFKENGYKEETAIKAFNSYDIAGWHDTHGKPVLNWKQKMINVWFTEENKIYLPKQVTGITGSILPKEVTGYDK